MAHSGSRPPENVQGKLFIEDISKTKVKRDWLSCLLKLPIFVVQKAAAPKNGVEFRQQSICAIICSLAMSYDDVQGHTTVLKKV